MKLFKQTDLVEQKVSDIASPSLTLASNERTTFYDNAFVSFLLGDLLYSRDPMAGVITQEVYRQSYPAIHELFTRPGTFEFYMTVFRSIWGNDVAVSFVVPGPGHLQVNINALAVRMDFAAARSIVDNAYVDDDIITEDGDNLIFQGTQGIKTQREIDAMMIEVHPEGVYVETTLTIGA